MVIEVLLKMLKIRSKLKRIGIEIEEEGRINHLIIEIGIVGEVNPTSLQDQEAHDKPTTEVEIVTKKLIRKCLLFI